VKDHGFPRPVTIAERDIELINPTSARRSFWSARCSAWAWKDGHRLRVRLRRAAHHLGLSNSHIRRGIEFRKACCERARRKIKDRGLADRLEILHKDASKYKFKKGAYDFAVCIGASFIWNGFGPTLRKLKQAVRPGGKIAIGEPYWNKTPAPKEYIKRLEGTQHTPSTSCSGWPIPKDTTSSTSCAPASTTGPLRNGELVRAPQMARGESTPSDRRQVIDWLHKNQEEYLRWGREYLGWAIYLMRPLSKA